MIFIIFYYKTLRNIVLFYLEYSKGLTFIRIQGEESVWCWEGRDDTW